MPGPVQLLPWDAVWRVEPGGGPAAAVWGLPPGPRAQALVASLTRGEDPQPGTERPWVAAVVRPDGSTAAAAALTCRAGFVWSREAPEAGGALVLAAAVGSLVAALASRPAIDEDFILAGLAIDTATSPTTAYVGVHREFPGTTVVWPGPGSARAEGSGAGPRRLAWSTPDTWPEPSIEGPGVVRLYREVFDEVVADLMPDDGPLCATLSAGLDSSFVVATLARLAAPGRPVEAFVHSPLPAAGLGPRGRFDPDDYPLALSMQRAYPGVVRVHRVINDELVQPITQAADTVLRSWVPPVNAANSIWLHAMAADALALGGGVLFMGERGNPAFSHDHPYALAYHLRRHEWRPALAIARRYPGDPGPRVRRGPQHLARRGAAAGRELLRPPRVGRIRHGEFLAAGVPLAAQSSGTGERTGYLEWLAAAWSRSLASAFAGWEVPLVDPFSSRRVTELAAAITPSAWARGGSPRGLARLIGADRVPPEIRHRVRRGGQSMDTWFLVAQAPELYLGEADALDPLLASVLDAGALRAEMRSYPWGEVRANAPRSLNTVLGLLGWNVFLRITRERLAARS